MKFIDSLAISETEFTEEFKENIIYAKSETYVSKIRKIYL